MITVVDERLREEARAFSLRFGCEDCGNFSPGDRRCANGYPVEPHVGIDLGARRKLEFCKEFELAGEDPCESA